MERSLKKFNFHHPSRCLLAGPSGSGKTYLILSIINNREKLFDVNIKKVIYCYEIYQTIFDDLKRDEDVTLHEGLIDEEYLKSLATEPILLIIDDLMYSSFKKEDSIFIGKLYTVLAHHLNTSVFFLAQNVFSKNTYFRDLSLNSNYLIFTRNARNIGQIMTLARQIFGKKSKTVEDIIYKTFKQPYTYLVINMSANNQVGLSIHLDILPKQVETVYVF